MKTLSPEYHGYIKFNLHPDRETVMVTKKETLIEGKTN